MTLNPMTLTTPLQAAVSEVQAMTRDVAQMVEGLGSGGVKPRLPLSSRSSLLTRDLSLPDPAPFGSPVEEGAAAHAHASSAGLDPDPVPIPDPRPLFQKPPPPLDPLPVPRGWGIRRRQERIAQRAAESAAEARSAQAADQQAAAQQASDQRLRLELLRVLDLLREQQGGGPRRQSPATTAPGWRRRQPLGGRRAGARRAGGGGTRGAGPGWGRWGWGSGRWRWGYPRWRPLPFPFGRGWSLVTDGVEGGLNPSPWEGGVGPDHVTVGFGFCVFVVGS